MTKTEMHELIEAFLAEFPERLSGNEVNARMADQLRQFIARDRTVLVEALRDYLAVRILEEKRQPEDAVREARMWLALEVAARLSLSELLPDIQSLLQDIGEGRTLLPVYEKIVSNYIAKLSS